MPPKKERHAASPNRSFWPRAARIMLHRTSVASGSVGDAPSLLPARCSWQTGRNRVNVGCTPGVAELQAGGEAGEPVRPVIDACSPPSEEGPVSLRDLEILFAPGVLPPALDSVRPGELAAPGDAPLSGPQEATNSFVSAESRSNAVRPLPASEKSPSAPSDSSSDDLAMMEVLVRGARQKATVPPPSTWPAASASDPPRPGPSPSTRPRSSRRRLDSARPLPRADEPLIDLPADADAQGPPSSHGPRSAAGGGPREPEPYDASPASDARSAVTDSALEDVLFAAAVHADSEPGPRAASEPRNELGSNALTSAAETRFEAELLGEPAPPESARNQPASSSWPELRPRSRDRAPARRRADSARKAAPDAVPVEDIPADPELSKAAAVASTGPGQSEPTEAAHSAHADDELANLDDEAPSGADDATSPAPSEAAPELPATERHSGATDAGPPVLARPKHDELWWAAAAAALILVAWLAAHCS